MPRASTRSGVSKKSRRESKSQTELSKLIKRKDEKKEKMDEIDSKVDVLVETQAAERRSLAVRRQEWAEKARESADSKNVKKLRDLLKEILKLTEREEEMADALKKERKAHVKAKAEWLKAVNSVEEQEKKQKRKIRRSSKNSGSSRSHSRRSSRSAKRSTRGRKSTRG